MTTIPELGLWRTSLEFRRGAPGGTFDWITYLNRYVVGLCKDTQCKECQTPLREGFTGGMLEVLLSKQQSRSGAVFYIAHIVRNEAAISSPATAASPDDRAASETDATQVTAFVYKDEKSGESIMIDCGAPPNMNGDATAVIRGLIARYKISGIVITHGHLDHWNEVPLDYEGPIHMSPLASSYLRRNLDFRGVAGKFKEGIFFPGDESAIEVGPFKLKPIIIPHSTQTCMFLGATSDGRTFLHVSDGKLTGAHWREEIVVRDRLARIGRDGGVDVFHVDNLNCHRPGFTPEESEVCQSVSRIIAANTGRIIIGMFASSLERIKAIAATALDLGRYVGFVGSGMRFARELLEDEGMVFTPLNPKLPMVIFASGCQAEPESVLRQEAEDSRSPAQLDISEQDTVIFSSRRIPGNEVAITEMVKKLSRKGCKIILNEGEMNDLGIDSQLVTEAFTHCSGHGHREDVVEAIKLVKPRAVVPAVRRGEQMSSLREICRELGVAVLEPSENQITI